MWSERLCFYISLLFFLNGFLVKPDFLFIYFSLFFPREKKEEEEEWDEDNEKEDEDAGVNKEMFVFLTHRERVLELTCFCL